MSRIVRELPELFVEDVPNIVERDLARPTDGCSSMTTR